jgi:hypothetical protein
MSHAIVSTHLSIIDKLTDTPKSVSINLAKLREIRRFKLVFGAMIFSFIYIRNGIQLHPTSVIEKEMNTTKKDIVDETANISLSRSILVLNRIRMDLLRQKYAGIINLSSFDQPQSDKTMTYSCEKRCNGWGDRIRGMMSVYILALLTRRRFMIDMENPCRLSQFLRPNIVNWTYSRSELTLSQNRSLLVIYAMDYHHASHRKIKNDVSLKNFTAEWEPYDDIRITTNAYLVKRALTNPLLKGSWLMGELPPKMVGDTKLFPLLFELLFKPTETLIRAAETVLLLPYKMLFCLHIREGSNPNHYHGSVVTIPGAITHIDRTGSRKSRPFNKRKRCDGFLKVLAEFLVLGECDVSILSRSGLSAWASRRRVSPTKTVYLHNDATQSIIPVQL